MLSLIELLKQFTVYPVVTLPHKRNSEMQKGIPIAEALCCGTNSCN